MWRHFEELKRFLCNCRLPCCVYILDYPVFVTYVQGTLRNGTSICRKMKRKRVHQFKWRLLKITIDLFRVCVSFHALRLCPVVSATLGDLQLWLLSFPCSTSSVNKQLIRESAECKTAHQFGYLKQWRTVGGGWCVQPPPVTEIPMAHQNRAKPNPIVKTVKNCWIWDANTPRCSEKWQ